MTCGYGYFDENKLVARERGCQICCKKWDLEWFWRQLVVEWEVGQKSFAKRLELVVLTTTTPLNKEVAGTKDCGR